MLDQQVEFSSVNEELREAYGATNYNVLGPPSFTLRIGVESPDLANLYRDYDVPTAAFLTACNPFSAPTPEHQNELKRAPKHPQEQLYIPNIVLSNMYVLLL